MDKIFKEKEASWDYAEVWSKFPVPARPSKEELKYLETELKRFGKNSKILILGSTIEYRSLCNKLGIRPYVADFDKSIYGILTKYSKEKFVGEHFLEVDWLKIKEKNKFDVIIGHRAINVIGKEVLQKFFLRMKRVLKPSGIFYCKGNVQFINDKTKLDSIRGKWAFKKNRRYPLFSYLEVELYFYCADRDGYVNYPKARKLVNNWYRQRKISLKDYNLMKILVSMSDDARFRGKISEHEIIKKIKAAGLKIDQWLILDKDICSNMPIIKLIK